MLKISFSVFRILVIFTCIGNADAVFAQEFLLKGVIFHRQNGQRVTNAQVSNKNNKTTVASNDLGWFSIKATIGDTIKFSKKDFSEYFYLVADQKEVVVQMSPVIQLNEVRILGQTKKQELDEAMRKYRGQGSFYNGKPPITAFSPFGGSPLTGLYELFGKTPKQAKHFQEFTKNETEQINIDKRFNKSLVKQNTDLTEEQVERFMEVYRPSYDQLVVWNDYDLFNYIKTSAQQLKDGKSPPPLKKLY